VRTNTLTNKQTPLQTSTSLRYATPVGKEVKFLSKSARRREVNQQIATARP